jgi:vitamin B12 transporter
VSLNFAEGFKAPTFNDLYFPFGGNADLKFETSTNKEIVYKGFYKVGSLVLSAYESEIENLIQWIPDANGIWAPQNIGAADISGIDLSYKVSYGNFNHKLIASSVSTEDKTTGNQLLLRAKKHYGYEFSYSEDDFSVFTQVQHVGKRPDTDFQTFMPTMLSSFTQVNLGMSYDVSNNWTLKLKVSDALDKAATLVSGYNPSGREYYLTLVHSN